MEMSAYQPGDKVMIKASSFINEQPYINVPGVVDFQCSAVAGVPGLVYVLVKTNGQRKPRSIATNQDNLVRI